MKYIVIGLGDYGGGLAEELMAIGHEVIGVDQNEGRVDNLKDKITTAFVLDATDELALETLPHVKASILCDLLSFFDGCDAIAV